MGLISPVGFDGVGQVVEGVGEVSAVLRGEEHEPGAGEECTLRAVLVLTGDDKQTGGPVSQVVNMNAGHADAFRMEGRICVAR